MYDLYEDATWFLAHRQKEAAGPRLVTLCREIARKQTTLISNTEKCISVFEYGGDAKDVEPGSPLELEERAATFNRAQNIVETAMAKIIKGKVTIMPLTQGGGYLQQARAKEMGKAIEGIFEENEFDEVEEDVVLDALTTDHGAGAVLITDHCDEVKIQHVPIEDVWFDEAEVRHRSPRSCYRIPKGGIDKYVAVEMFASPDDVPAGAVGTPEDRKQAILKASSSPEDWRRTSAIDTKSRVDIFEAWHLPSGEVEYEDVDEEYEDDDGETKTRSVRRAKDHDGRHVVAVAGEDGTLIDEPWDGNGGMFPILLYVPRRRRRTIWGLSLMRGLVAPQRELEKLSRKIQNMHQKMGMSGIMAPVESGVNTRELTTGEDGPGFVVEYNGQVPPQQFTPEPVTPGTYQYRDMLSRDMGEMHGVSAFSSSSTVPAGLQQASGKALQAFDDSEDVRLLPYHRERERFRIRASWLAVHTARRIVERKGKYESRYQEKHGLAKVEWAELLEDAKDFTIRVFPMSALAKQPAAKFAQLTELLNAGAITVEQFRRLFELPDLEAENELETADRDIIAKALDTMVVRGTYVTPLPFDDMMSAISLASKFANLCRLREVPEERIKLIVDYIEDLKALKDQATAQTMPAGPMVSPGAPPPPMDPSMAPPPAMPDPNAPMPPPVMPPMAA